MDNFYKTYINTYFNELGKKEKSFYSIFRKNLSKRASYIYYYSKVTQLLSNFFKFLTKKQLTKINLENTLINKNNFVINNLDDFKNTYDLFSDERSKDKFISYIVFKSLDSFIHRLPFDYEKLEQNIAIAKSLKINTDENIYDLKTISHDVKLIGDEIGVLLDFIDEQYAYDKIVEVVKDDIVIDCGGATGDTALYFSSKGAKKVFVFEFIQSSLLEINKQIQNNLHFKEEIQIVENAVWNSSNDELSYLDRGNASIVDGKNVYLNKVITKSIDTLVQEENIIVDFIKMDIEGAELPALQGARNTIKTQTPKLAISVYHKENDLIEIPKIISELNSNYDFYFDYYTDTGAEAILYAINRIKND